MAVSSEAMPLTTSVMLPSVLVVTLLGTGLLHGWVTV